MLHEGGKTAHGWAPLLGKSARPDGWYGKVELQRPKRTIGASKDDEQMPLVLQTDRCVGSGADSSTFQTGALLSLAANESSACSFNLDGPVGWPTPPAFKCVQWWECQALAVHAMMSWARMSHMRSVNQDGARWEALLRGPWGCSSLSLCVDMQERLLPRFDTITRRSARSPNKRRSECGLIRPDA